MLTKRSLFRAMVLTAFAVNAAAASTRDFPDKPIRLITFPGGFADWTARTIAGAMSGFGQPIVIENRGGTRSVAAEMVADATPDGYTLLVLGSTLWQTPMLYKAAYDPVRDFVPITIATSQPSLLVVRPEVPAKSVQELIALAKGKPGELKYSSNPAGSENHLSAELFKAMAHVDIVRVRFVPTAPALAALLEGQVNVMFPNAAAVVPHMNSGRLRALAVTSEHPSVLFPSLPTISASGLPGFESGTIQGVLAPAGTPSVIVERLNRGIVRALNREDVKKELFAAGVEVVANSPQEFASFRATDRKRWQTLITSAHIRPD